MTFRLIQLPGGTCSQKKGTGMHWKTLMKSQTMPEMTDMPMIILTVVLTPVWTVLGVSLRKVVPTETFAQITAK